MHAVRHVPDFCPRQEQAAADIPDQQCPPQAVPMPVTRFSYAPVAHNTHTFQLAVIAGTAPADTFRVLPSMWCRACGTYATRKWSRRVGQACPQAPTSEQQLKMLQNSRFPQHSKAANRLIHIRATTPEELFHLWSHQPAAR
eukprot:869731-Amphidinium_carterae.1